MGQSPSSIPPQISISAVACVRQAVINYKSCTIESVELENGEIITNGDTLYELEEQLRKDADDDYEGDVQILIDANTSNTPVRKIFEIADELDQCSKIRAELIQAVKTHAPSIVELVDIYLYFYDKKNAKQIMSFRTKSLKELLRFYERLERIQEKLEDKMKEVEGRVVGRILGSLSEWILSLFNRDVSFTHRTIRFVVKEITVAALRSELATINAELEKVRDPIDQMQEALENVPIGELDNVFHILKLRKQNNILRVMLMKKNIRVNCVVDVVQEIEKKDAEIDKVTMAEMRKQLLEIEEQLSSKKRDFRMKEEGLLFKKYL